MRILTKYTLKECVFPFFLSIVLFSFLLIMNKLLTLVDLVLKHGVGIWTVGKLVAYILPATFAITVPMSLLVGVILALGRLSVDFEITALKAGGVSLGAVFKPILWLGLAVSLAMLVFNEYALPNANANYKALFYDVISQRSSVAIQEGAFVSEFEGLAIRVGEKDRKGDRLDDITVIKLGKDKEPLQWIQARHGRLVSDRDKLRVYLELFDGTVQFLGQQGLQQLTTLSYRSSTVDLDIQGSLAKVQEEKKPQEMSVREILAVLAKMPRADHRRFNFKVEMHKKLAIPFACLSFLIIAFPLGVLVRKGGRLTGFIFAIGLIFLYYLFLSIGQTLGDDGRLPAWLAVWFANFTLGGLGALLTWAALRERGGFLPSLR